MKGLAVLLLLIVLSYADQKPLDSGRDVSEARLARVEKSILKRKERGIRKIKKYNKKINDRIDKTLNIISKSSSRVMKKASEMENRLTTYGTRKLKHLEELIDMADEDIRDRLRPILAHVKQEMKLREKVIKLGIGQLITAYGAVFAQTTKQVNGARIIGAMNNAAAARALHLMGDKVVEGLKKTGAEGLKVRALREAKHVCKKTEKRIYQSFHGAERQEVQIIKKADVLLKDMKHKARTLFSKLRREQRRAYRKLFRKATIKMMHVLFNQNGIDDYLNIQMHAFGVPDDIVVFEKSYKLNVEVTEYENDNYMVGKALDSLPLGYRFD